MDNNKDISQSHISQTQIPKDQHKDLNPIDLFSKDPSFVFVYKKTEKLATALYMVSNLFSDSEPMKWTLRTKISSLLSFIIGFRDILESKEEQFFVDVKTRILEIVSLLEIAFRSGLVSAMNFSILKGEFMKVVQFMGDARKSARHDADLKENFFEIPHTPRSLATVGGGAPLGHDSVLNIHKRTNRQNIIINLLKKKDSLTIKDIARTITDCSEKTIQRELISLIEVGVVKKTGERRWSKYSLVSLQ